MSSDHVTPTRRLPVIVRPRGGELSGSYLTRLAHGNCTEPATLARLIGRVGSGILAHPDSLADKILTLNEPAFTRLLVLTGLDRGRLLRAIPCLTPQPFPTPWAAKGLVPEPAIACASLAARTGDCPECRRRHDGARLDTRLFPHRMACLTHGYWLYDPSGPQRLDVTLLPEVATAYRRFARLARSRGSASAMHAYETAEYYLHRAWRLESMPPWWYPYLVERWWGRLHPSGSPSVSVAWQLPGWATHPEVVAVAIVFANPEWAARAVPRPGAS